MVTAEGDNNKWKVEINVGGANPFSGPNHDGPFEGKANIELLAINPAPFGSQTTVKIDGTLNATASPCLTVNPFACAFPLGQVLVIDSNGKTVEGAPLTIT